MLVPYIRNHNLTILHSQHLVLFIPGYEDALPLFDCDAIEIAMIHLLAKRFWPGPLSIVARASSTVPAEVTAQTGFVSVR